VSLFWEPRWVRVKVSYKGVNIVTCQDMVSKLYICPLCSDVERLCPEGRETNIIIEDATTFFTIEDLINHLRTHAYSQTLKRKLISPRAEESGKEESQ